MTIQKRASLFHRVDTYEHGICLYLNRFSERSFIRYFFSGISRLGNGVFWYVLMLLLPVFFAYDGFVVGVGMGLAALFNVGIYKFLKGRLVRERPYISFSDLACGTPPLDRYSFPSGHTLHAVSFTIICVYFFPAFAPLLIPMAMLVAASRVILGLHYPTDVAVGAVIGALVAMTAVPVLAVLV